MSYSLFQSDIFREVFYMPICFPNIFAISISRSQSRYIQCFCTGRYTGWYSCDCIGAFERISSGLAGFTYSGYKKMDVCICSLCTCCRACVSPVLSETWRKSHRSFFWSIIGTAAAIPPGATSHLLLSVIFFFDRCKAASLQKHSYVYTVFSDRIVLFP